MTLPATPAPIRPPWQALPQALRTRIERALGTRVVQTSSQTGGFSPGFALRLVLDDGRRFFAKGTDAEINRYSHELHQAEARILRRLDEGCGLGHLPIPRLVTTIEYGSWYTLVLEDVEGRLPDLPWTRDQLRQSCLSLHAIHTQLSDVATSLSRLTTQNHQAFQGWARLAQSGDLARIPPWAAGRLDTLVELESGWSSSMPSETLLHTDLRADNILITDTGAQIVDWAHACSGPAWADFVLMAPSVSASGGPAPEEFLTLAGASGAPADGLTALVCAVAGYFSENMLKPAPAGMPRARTSQARQGAQALSWLRRRLEPATCRSPRP